MRIRPINETMLKQNTLFAGTIRGWDLSISIKDTPLISKKFLETTDYAANKKEDFFRFKFDMDFPKLCARNMKLNVPACLRHPIYVRNE